MFNSEVSILGIPFKEGQRKDGVDLGPKYLREAGLVSQLENAGNFVRDAGDLSFEIIEADSPSQNVNAPRTSASSARRISAKVKQIMSTGSRCLALGGDHSLALGTIHGHLAVEPDTIVVWVDAHPDLNPPHASVSGNSHGMPVSFLLEETRMFIPPVVGYEWLRPCLKCKDLIYIGIRSIDPAENLLIKTYGIDAYNIKDVKAMGIESVMDEIIDKHNPGGNRPFHLSFDIDALDPDHAPSTGTPEINGMTLQEGTHVARRLAETGCLQFMDMVEVNPGIGSRSDVETTVSNAVEIIQQAFTRNVD